MRSSLRNLGLALCLGAPLATAGCGGHSPSDPSTGSSTAAPVSSAGTGGGGSSSTAGVAVEASALPAAAAVQPPAPEPVTALAFKLAASEDVDLASIDVVASGSVDETLLGQAILVQDDDGDQTIDAGEPQLASAPTALQDDGTYRFDIQPPVRLAAGDTLELVVAIDAAGLTGLAQARLAGETIELSLADAAAVLASDAAGSPAVVTGSFPVSGSTTLEVNEHVLISEICTGPGSGATSAEFVELFNPTAQPIALDDYYLTDFTNDPTYGEFYWKLPTGADFGPAGSTYSSDFIVRFPAGATIGAGEVLVVAIDGEGFKAAHGGDADYCLRNAGTTSAEQMLSWTGTGVDFAASPVSSGVGLTGPSGGTTGTGELVCLFTWDGVSDLIQDVDLVNYGGATFTNTSVNKSPNQQATNPQAPDVQVDSAFDNDRATSTFLPDSDDLYQYDRRAPLGASIKRVDFTEGQEIKQGGNGISGHNETSEDFGDGMGGDGTFVSIPLATDATPGRIE